MSNRKPNEEQEHTKHSSNKCRLRKNSTRKHGKSSNSQTEDESTEVSDCECRKCAGECFVGED